LRAAREHEAQVLAQAAESERQQRLECERLAKRLLEEQKKVIKPKIQLI
jgi:hypothetical protein